MYWMVRRNILIKIQNISPQGAVLKCIVTLPAHASTMPSDQQVIASYRNLDMISFRELSVSLFLIAFDDIVGLLKQMPIILIIMI